MPATGVSRHKVTEILSRESAAFSAARPRSAELLESSKTLMPNGVPCSWMDGFYVHDTIFVDRGDGAWFWDVDGHKYLDMNQADLSMNCGYGPKALTEAIEKRVADGSQFLLPTPDSIDVCEALKERFELPFWQFTLSASGANMEAIRIARAYTGKQKVLVFAGKYHGHIEETMHNEGTKYVGFHEDFGKHTIEVPFNDLEAAENAFKSRDIACVLTEPALTNIGVIKPEPGFLQGMKSLCEDHGALFILDETHTQVCAWGGLKRVWGLECDMLSTGKSVAAGIPIGAYGMSAALGEFVARHMETEKDTGADDPGNYLALGGTLYGNALSITAAKVALTKILTKEAYEKTEALGGKLIAGLQSLFENFGFDWQAQDLYSRSGYTFGPVHPTTEREFATYADSELYHAMRAYYANREVWEAISTAGPAASFVMTESDIDFYLSRVEDFLSELKRT